MGRHILFARLLPVLGLAGLIAALPAPVHAQAVALPAGVLVDAQGVLHKQEFPDWDLQLTRKWREAARAGLNHNLATPSKRRMISLNRLEEAIKERLDKGLRPTDEMLNLAGLTRVQYVFCMPDSKDVVIAGPAEGWGKDMSGRVCGITSGRPVIELQDLIVALRVFPPDGSQGGTEIGCSIDPTKEGLARENDFIRSHGAPAPNQAAADAFAAGLRNALGFQNVTVSGVPATTHFAQVLVEADYRMKLIGLGMEAPPIPLKGKLKSYVDYANPAGVAKNAMARWYFVPNYECVKVAKDELAMELVGEGVKLVGADEVVAADGVRHSSRSVNGASHRFTEGFTKFYPQLASYTPVYAQLRNLIDMSVAAAFIQEKDYAAKIGWKMSILRDEKLLPTETYAAPKQVETVCAATFKGSHLMTPIGGGVHIEPRQAIESDKLLREKDGETGKAREQVNLKGLAKGQWWWDN